MKWWAWVLLPGGRVAHVVSEFKGSGRDGDRYARVGCRWVTTALADDEPYTPSTLEALGIPPCRRCLTRLKHEADYLGELHADLYALRESAELR